MKLLTYHVMISEKKTIAVEFNRFILWVFESSSIEEKQRLYCRCLLHSQTPQVRF